MQQASAEEHLNKHVLRTLGQHWGAEVSDRTPLLPKYKKYDPSQDRKKSNASFADSYTPPWQKKKRAAKRKAISKAKAAAKAMFKGQWEK